MRELFFIALLLIYNEVLSQDKLVIIKADGSKTETGTDLVDSVTFPGGTTMRIHYWDESISDILLADVDSLRMTPDKTTAETDREALVAFFNSTGGPDWTNNTNWCSQNPLALWNGITTDMAGRVISINLWQNNLNGNIPAEIVQLTKLKTIRLALNSLTGSIPPGLGHLSNLEELMLLENKLSGSIPRELGQLSGLKILNLGSNQLTGLIPSELGLCDSLLHLLLNVNNLTGPIPAELGRLENLEQLYLGRNQLTGEIPPELGGIKNIRNMDFSQNKLSGIIPPVLGTLSNLKRLGLGYNELSGSIPPELGKLSVLESLGLETNFITGSIPVQLSQISGLKTLDLECNQLEGSIPVEFGQLMNLETLHLNFNRFKGNIPSETAVLFSLPEISEIDLTDNQYSGVIPSSLVKHPKWNELVWGIVEQQPGYVLERETVKIFNSEVTDIEGVKIDLDSLWASNKLTVVFKWSDSDPFSGQFLPVLKSVYDEYIGKGLSVLSYSRVWADRSNESSLLNYINDNQMNWTNVLIYDMYGIDGVQIAQFTNLPGRTTPNVHIVNSRGEVVFSDQLWDKRADFENFVAAELGPMYLYESSDFTRDGLVKKLQSATSGNGPDLILLGDGFVDTAFVTGGAYEIRMKEAVEHFFSVEPMKSYRDHFNVFIVNAVSKNGVFRDDSETVFNSQFGEGTNISGNIEKIKEYAQKAGELNHDGTIIITVLNSPKYAGTSYIFEDASVSFTPIVAFDTKRFGEILIHEGAGHGLGKLGDEYIDYYETITQEALTSLLNAQSKGWYQNLSLSSSEFPWSHFIGHPNYLQVGVFEGGYYYWKGVWKPETNSCMINNIPYFNAPGREQIVKRILLSAGITYSWDDFIKNDKYEPVKGIGEIMPYKKMEPLSPPVILNSKLFEK